MPVEKILQRIQTQIGELGNTLESFVEETIQPTAADCDHLRKQMNDLLEDLAIYKHYKLTNELSPSFNIHAKLSEKEPVEEQYIEPVQEPVKTSERKREETKSAAEPETQKAKSPLVIGINDKFRFINELFSQNASEYHIALEQLTNLNTWHETEIYLNSLKNVYGWKENNEVVRYFYTLIKKRFE